MLRLFCCASRNSAWDNFGWYVCVRNVPDKDRHMSECTATFRQYHTRHFWGFVDIVVVIQHVDLWKTGLASWHSRRCVQAERYEDALAWADEYLRFAPRSPEAYHNRAAVYSKLDESELALADYIRAADVDQTRWDTVELLLDQLIEHERAELFWKIYDLAQPHHAKHAAHYLSTRRDLPNRPPGVAAPADAEPKGTEPHEPDESGQLV
jgi:tetratricopeptide (TPR) repeat protein